MRIGRVRLLKVQIPHAQNLPLARQHGDGPTRLQTGFFAHRIEGGSQRAVDQLQITGIGVAERHLTRGQQVGLQALVTARLLQQIRQTGSGACMEPVGLWVQQPDGAQGGRQQLLKFLDQTLQNLVASHPAGGEFQRKRTQRLDFARLLLRGLHIGQRLHQAPDFVAAAHAHRRAEVAVSQGTREGHGLPHWQRDAAHKSPGQRAGHQHAQRKQGQHTECDLLCAVDPCLQGVFEHLDRLGIEVVEPVNCSRQLVKVHVRRHAQAATAAQLLLYQRHAHGNLLPQFLGLPCQTRLDGRVGIGRFGQIAKQLRLHLHHLLLGCLKNGAAFRRNNALRQIDGPACAHEPQVLGQGHRIDHGGLRQHARVHP